MLNLALWLKKNGFRADQVQTFTPSPMATATAMYHSGRNPLKGLSRNEARPDLTERVDVVKSEKRRRLHKAFLRYHDAANWPLLREALQKMGRADLIGPGKHQLIPGWQPAGSGGSTRQVEGRGAKPRDGRARSAVQVPGAGGAGRPETGRPEKGRILTQHTGLPPRPGVKPAARPAAVGRPVDRAPSRPVKPGSPVGGGKRRG